MRETDYKKIIAQLIPRFPHYNLPGIEKTRIEIKIFRRQKQELNAVNTFLISSSGQPICFLKIPKYRDGKPAFEAINKEADIIGRIKEQSAMSGHLPQLYALTLIDNVPIVIYQAYSGIMLNELMDREEDLSLVKEHLQTAVNLLFDRKLMIEPDSHRIGDDFIDKWIFAPLRILESRLPEETKGFRKYIDQFLSANDPTGQSLPSLIAHNDYTPWNILCENMIIFDWEDADFNGLPLYDLYVFLTMTLWILFYGETKSKNPRSFKARKTRATFLQPWLNGVLSSYCSSFALSPMKKDLLFLIVGLNHACFFLSEKRNEEVFARSWLLLLKIQESKDCFERYIQRTLELDSK